MRMILTCCVTAACLFAFSSFADAQGKTSDWPQYRGPQRDGICTETGLLKEWPKAGPPLVWDSRKVNAPETVGLGFSSVAIVKGKLYTLGDRKKPDNGCFVVCLDANTGKEIWHTKIGPTSSRGGFPGPRCIPTIDGDRLYAIHPDGILACLKVSDGSTVWSKGFKEWGASAQGWGYCESPTIDGDKLIFTPGAKDALMVALNKVTGETLWKTKLPAKLNIGGGAGYSSIVSTEAGGVRQYVNVTGSNLGIVGVEAGTGKFLWNYTKAVRGTANIPTAIVNGDFVFTSTGYNAGAALLKIASDGAGSVKAEEEYYLPSNKLQNHHGGVVMLGDHIYGGHGHNQGAPFCLEWKTGKFAWGPQRDERGSSSVLFADGNLYFRHQNGDVALVEATPKAFNVKGTFKANIGSNNWPHPVIWDGKLYLRGQDTIQCYDVKQH